MELVAFAVKIEVELSSSFSSAGEPDGYSVRVSAKHETIAKAAFGLCSSGLPNSSPVVFLAELLISRVCCDTCMNTCFLVKRVFSHPMDADAVGRRALLTPRNERRSHH